MFHLNRTAFFDIFIFPALIVCKAGFNWMFMDSCPASDPMQPDVASQLKVGFIGAGNMAFGLAKGICSGEWS